MSTDVCGILIFTARC